MADRPTIERIAKILARANSDNGAEAEAALHGAFARMNRDGVSFSDLLSLPEQDLYQDALVRLAEHIVKNQPDLSPSQRRALYAAYLAKIVAKFPDERGRGGDSAKDQAQQEREDAARAYEERRRQEETRRSQEEARRGQEEARRNRSEPPPRQEKAASSNTGAEKPFKRQNGNTTKANQLFPLSLDINKFPISFSASQFFLFFFGASSYIGSIYSYPKLAARLLVISCVVGSLTAVALFVGGALILGNWPFEPLRLLFGFLFSKPVFGFVLIIFITSYVFYERGWYPRGPLQGETDVVSIASTTYRLALGLAWRMLWFLVIILNSIYTLGARLKNKRQN